MTHLLSILAVAAIAAATNNAATAQAYPEPVPLVVAYPAGGGLDFVGRTLAQRLSETWNQLVTVENKSGASGSIGADAAAKAKPDGLTLLLASPAEVLAPEKSFVPVVLAGETPLAIVGHTSLPATNLAELVSTAKKSGQVLSYGTPGAGSSMHFAGEALTQWSGLSMTHVPYRGAAPAVNDLLGNKSGRLKMLAVTTARRSPTLPDVPAASEVPGRSEFQFSNWIMVLAPAGTPADTVSKIAAGVSRLVLGPVTRKKLQEAGVEPAALQGAELMKFMQRERVRYSAVSKARDVRYPD